MQDSLPFTTRLWFAYVCFIRVLFDGAFAARAWRVRDAALELEPADAQDVQGKDLGESQDDAAAASPGSDATATTPAEASVRRAAADAALQLLGLLQREGRLVDFLKQDVAGFDDADIGAAARVVHEGCRKTLQQYATIEPVRSEDEGANLALDADFDASSIKLTGAVGGAPPYQGVLRHRGWRAIQLDLPEIVGEPDLSVLAPAEVEL